MAEQAPAAVVAWLSERTTRDSAGPDCQILAMRKDARWPGLPTDLEPSALPVAEQSSRAGAMTGVGVMQAPVG